MAAGLVTLNILDGDGSTRTARFWSSDGTTAGLLMPPAFPVDTAGNVADATHPNAFLGATVAAIGTVAPTGRTYKTVAASQTAQVLGTGATGDVLDGLLIVPATTSPGNVIILDNAVSITVFTGGANSVSNLVPFWVALNSSASVSGAWKVTTGANVSAVAVGKFTP